MLAFQDCVATLLQHHIVQRELLPLISICMFVWTVCGRTCAYLGRDNIVRTCPTQLYYRAAVYECYKTWNVENSPHQVDLTSIFARSSKGGIRPAQRQRRPCPPRLRGRGVQQRHPLGATFFLIALKDVVLEGISCTHRSLCVGDSSVIATSLLPPAPPTWSYGSNLESAESAGWTADPVG